MKSEKIAYFKGYVNKILGEEEVDIAITQEKGIKQNVQVLLENGERVETDYLISNVSGADKKLQLQDRLVLNKVPNPDGSFKYVVQDKNRINGFYFILAFFLIILIIVAGKKSFGSLLGLIFSIGVIFYFTIPQIVVGQNILLIGLFSALIITIVTIYLAHGFNKLSNLSIVSVLFCLMIVVNLSFLFTKMAYLYGTGDDSYVYLQLSTDYFLNLKGMIIVAVIISAIGVLDDVAATQIATVKQLRETNPFLPQIELFKRAMSVGKEHIASMVNSLVLVYVGMALPMVVILFASNKDLFLNLNLERIMQELVSSLIISIVLLIAVPISTYLGAISFGFKK